MHTNSLYITTHKNDVLDLAQHFSLITTVKRIISK